VTTGNVLALLPIEEKISNVLNKEDMKTVDKAFEILRNEGFVPKQEEFGISFKYQMATVLMLDNENDENFFNMVVPYIYEVDEENELDVLRAVNKINNEMKVVKLVVNEGNVWVCFEAEIEPEAVMEELVRFAVPTVCEARVRFYDALKNSENA